MGWLVRLSLLLLVLLTIAGAISHAIQRHHPSAVMQVSNRESLAAASGQSRAEPRPSNPTGSWTVDRGRSSFDDSSTVQLLLRANRPIMGWPGKVETPLLVLRCLEHKTEVIVQTGMSPNPEYGRFERATVRLRLDSDPATQRLASKSTDGNALFLPAPVALIRTLVKHKRMIFGFTPFNSPPVETDFDLEGLAVELRSLREVCPAN
jgi:hypothetical protein